MNPTIVKFGYPATLIREFEHWLVLLRPAQVTLGSLVLAARSDATAYSKLPPEGFTEQARVIAAIERALAGFVDYERINYVMLMMVGPQRPLPRHPALCGAAQLGRDRFPGRRLARAAAARQRSQTRC